MPRPTILIVDDDFGISRGVGLRMRASGFNSITAFDGEQAIASAIECQPDAIVLDVRMPKLDGISALKRIREDDRTSHIPVVMLSACLFDRDKALKAGARFFLPKPFRSVDLVTAVKAVTKQNQEVLV